MSEKNNLETALTNFKEMQAALNDLTGLAEMAEEEGDETVVAEVMQQLEELKQQARRGELEALLSGEVDANDAYLEVHAGSGGTEAQDWAEMLLRMYSRWAEKHKYKLSYVEETEGEVAGLKSATVKISGHNAYGGSKARAACTGWCGFRRLTATRGGIRALRQSAYIRWLTTAFISTSTRRI